MLNNLYAIFIFNIIMVSLIDSFKKDFGIILISALVFIVSFLWKDLLVDIEDALFPKAHGIIGRVIYIAIMTCILLISVFYIKRSIKIDNIQNPQFDDNPDIDISE